MEYAEIMKEILSNLTGDPEKNVAYIKEKADQYRLHEYGPEILRALCRLVLRLMPEEARDQIEYMVKNQNLYIYLMHEEAKTKLIQKDLDGSEKIFLQILPGADDHSPDRFTEFYDFRNPLERAYFIITCKPEKEILPCSVSYNDVFMTYTYLLIEKGDYGRAFEIIEDGLKRNPLHINLLFEKGSIYRTQKRYEENFELARECHPKAYQRADLARCYREFGYFFVEKEKWDAAICCYLLAGFWQKSEIGYSELYTITQRTGKIINESYYLDCIEEILTAESIPAGPNPVWIELAASLGELMGSRNEIDEAKRCYAVAYELTGADQFHEKYLELNQRLM